MSERWLERLFDAWDCWRGDHAWYTVRARDGRLIYAPPCTDCGAPNPEAQR